MLFICMLGIMTQHTFGQESKTISGKVSYGSVALTNVHIVNQSSKVAVKSDDNGNYKITAKTGEEISFSYVGLKTMTILIEDVTSILNIEMTEEINELDDVVVTAKLKNNRPPKMPVEEAMNMEMVDPFGKRYKPARSGGAVHYMDNEKMKTLPAGYSLEQALNGRFSGIWMSKNAIGEDILIYKRFNDVYPMTIDYDGFFSEVAPPINFAEVEHLFIIKKKNLIVIRTRNHPDYIKRKKERIAEKHRNQDFYDPNSVAAELDFSQNDLLVDLGKEKEIYGKVSFENYPVSDVLITVAGKGNIQIYSDQEGKYSLKVKIGDILQFSHASYEPLSIFVEDVTEELNIEMIENIIELEEVSVQANNTKGVVTSKKEKRDEKYTTSKGEFDPKKSGFVQNFTDGENLSNVYENIQQAVVGKIPGLMYDKETEKVYSTRARSMTINGDYPMSWEVDGLFMTNPPPLDLSQIKSVRVLKSLGATNRYGSQAAGGVIIIETTFGNFRPGQTQKSSFLAEFANSEFYQNDAAISSLELKEQNKYAQSLKVYKNKFKAYKFYQEELKGKIENYGDHISVAMQFFEFYQDQRLASKVLNELAITHNRNPEILKSIAYYYQLLGNKRAAITSYERVFKLRPQHAQSFRDLANAYVDYDLYDKAWKLYYAYMIKEKVTSEEGIGELMYNDMEWLFYQRAHQTQVKRNFIPIHRNAKEFKRDVRMVFEWNTSEAEFELEFVSPDRRTYTFDHSLFANKDLIHQEKKIGYSSKMFVVEDLGEGEWLVNLTYKGNKKTDPTFLKLTTYYNWGKPNEKKDVNVYKLEIQNQKASLLKFDREFEVFQKVAKN